MYVIRYNTALGVYAACFYINGRWRFPIMDDYLPVSQSRTLPGRVFPTFGAHTYVPSHHPPDGLYLDHVQGKQEMRAWYGAQVHRGSLYGNRAVYAFPIKS